jgi:hypothetical protein
MSKRTMVVFLFAFAVSIPHARTQTSGEVKKNEAGLVIGATLTPSQTLASGISATPRTLTFKSSLALGRSSGRGGVRFQELIGWNHPQPR